MAHQQWVRHQLRWMSAIAAIDEVAAEVIADEAPDIPETGPDVDPGMVDEQLQDDSSDAA